MSSNRIRNLAISALLLGGGIAVGLTLSSNLNLQSVSRAQETSLRGGSLESPFVGVASKVQPAVVSVEVKRRVNAGDATPYGDLFHRFFPDDSQRRRSIELPSSGSGFIIDREGHILTNNHVVQGASDITIRLLDHRSFKAKLLGRDPFTDLAMVKIEGENLPVAELGNSDEMRVGDWAIAIGNPLGELEGSLTVGVVSAKGRAGLIIGDSPNEGPGYQDFIQTDAAINRGNSGGPLCNIKGQVIGINTAINPAGQGIGFAIPVNIALKLREQLASGKPITHGFLGVGPQELDETLAEGLGLKGGSGVVISAVTEGSPAVKAGLEKGDVITEFDRQKITSVGQFRRIVADTPIGRRVPVVVVRDGKQQEMQVTLASRNDEDVKAAPEASPSKDWLGLKVEGQQGVSRALRGRASGGEEQPGVVVTSVDDASPADEAGIQEGDLIQEVNGAVIRNTADFSAAMKKARGAGKPIVMLLNRQGAAQYIAVKPKQ